MIRVMVEVSDDALLHRLVVQSRSVQGALSFVEEHCMGDGEARIVFPIEAEAFFVKDPDAIVGLVQVEKVGELPASRTQDLTSLRSNGRAPLITNVTAASRTGDGRIVVNGHASQSVEDEREVTKGTAPGLSNRGIDTNVSQKGGLHA